MTREEIIDYVSKSYQEYAASINYELGVGDKKFFVQCSVYGISPKLACQILKIAEKEERNTLLLIYERSADLSEVIAENGVAENIKTSEWFNAALSIMESYPSYAGRVYVINLIAEISEKDDYFIYADLFNALNNKEDITYLYENLMRRRNSRKNEATKAIERKFDALEQKINNLPDGIANRNEVTTLSEKKKQLEEENNSLLQKIMS